MAKIERKTQKIFSGINPSKLGVFGSAQLLSPTTSTDLDVLQSSAYEEGWTDAVISGDKRPPLEEFNGIKYVNDTQTAYLFQEGIAVWDAGTEYYENSIVKLDGTVNLYKSLTNNNIGNALTDVVNWKFLTDFNGSVAEQNKVIVNNLADFPAPVANVITLIDGKDYRISGVVNIGINRIVFGDNCGITGDNPQNDILVYEGVGNMFTAINQNLILLRIGISCDAGTLFDATDIDYTIDPSVDPFQGRSKRFYVFNCNPIGGVAGNGSNLGAVEGFGTVNFNANLITGWDAGFKLSNGLSFQGLNNKSVLWNGQGATMFTLRDNNWSAQTGGAGSYIPTGINALNFNGNILHPRTADYGINIEPGSTTVSGNVSGNIFLSTGLTTGGTFNPASLGYNDLPAYNIQGNQGIADNTATIQASSNKFSNIVTTINTQNVPVKLNLDNTIKTSENLLFSSRILVTSAATFEVGQIITGGTSTYIGKIQSIDLVNDYIYVEYVIDGAGASQFFTVGETITSLTASTTYNGIDGSYKYYGFKDISTRLLATITMEKVLNGRDIFEIIPYKNGIALSEISAIQYLEQPRPRPITCQGIIDLIQDDILEIYIQNVDSNDNSECQSYVLNISAR